MLVFAGAIPPHILSCDLMVEALQIAILSIKKRRDGRLAVSSSMIAYMQVRILQLNVGLLRTLQIIYEVEVRKKRTLCLSKSDDWW